MMMFNILFYYFLVFFGSGIVYWIIFSRFIRERLPKEIPFFLNEWGFWILFYICCIYLLRVIILARPPKKVKGVYKDFFELSQNIIYFPLTSLDHLLKYNIFVKYYYYIFMYKFVKFLLKRSANELKLYIIFFQIAPRAILVFVLLKDIFFFEKLEIIYHFIFLGILPLFHRYIKYSIKDLKIHYTEILAENFEEVGMTDEAYIYDHETEWERTEDNKFHGKDLSLKEYIEFKLEQALYKTYNVKYEENPCCFDQFYLQYKIDKYGHVIKKITDNDIKNMHEDFHIFMPQILQLGIFHGYYSFLEQTSWIKYLKIFIFGSYFICWSYILYKSYCYHPVEFTMLFNFLHDLNSYLYKEFDIIYCSGEFDFTSFLKYKFMLEFFIENLLLIWGKNKLVIYKIISISFGIIIILNILNNYFKNKWLHKKVKFKEETKDDDAI